MNLERQTIVRSTTCTKVPWCCFPVPRRHEATVERLLLLLNMASFMLRQGLSKVGVVVAIAALVLCCASDASGNEQRENEKEKRYFLNQGRELMKSVSTDDLGDSAPSLENHVKGPDALRFQSEQGQTQKGGKGGKSTKKKKSSKKSARSQSNLQRKAQRRNRNKGKEVQNRNRNLNQTTDETETAAQEKG